MSTLNGIRVLNTRPHSPRISLSHAIHESGGISIDMPALIIEKTPFDWLRELPDLTTVHQAIFISPNAVDYFFAALKHSSISWPTSIHVIALGHATASALRDHDISVHYLPVVADSEHLLKLDVLQQINQQKMLLIKGIGGRPLLANTLNDRGAFLYSLDVYYRKAAVFKKEYIDSIWQDDAVDIILFTSEQAMQNLLDLFTGAARTWLCSKPWLVISPRLEMAGFLLGAQNITVCSHDSILNAIKGLMHDHDHG